jgi:hypothetical protein
MGAVGFVWMREYREGWEEKQTTLMSILRSFISRNYSPQSLEDTKGHQIIPLCGILLMPCFMIGTLKFIKFCCEGLKNVFVHLGASARPRPRLGRGRGALVVSDTMKQHAEWLPFRILQYTGFVLSSSQSESYIGSNFLPTSTLSKTSGDHSDAERRNGIPRNNSHHDRQHPARETQQSDEGV